MRGEAVRGGFPEPGFYSLPGLEQARAYLRGLVPRPPLSHLLGLRVTQVGVGTATCTMPVSPWLQFPSAVLDTTVLVETALSMATLTTVPGGVDARTVALSMSYFRPATMESEGLVARARTTSTGTTFMSGEVLVEDALGREVLRASGMSLVRPADPAPPPPAELPGRVEEPRYPTPDPYRRPLPAGVGAIPDEDWERHDGFAISRGIQEGTFPTVPLMALFGATFAFEPGRGTLELPRSEWLCWHRRDRLAPGVVAGSTFWAMAASVSTEMPRGAPRVGVLDLAITLIRPVSSHGPDLFAEGRTTSRDREFVFTAGVVGDGPDDRVAAGHYTTVFLERRPRPAPPTRAVFTTLMFTDLTDSTKKAAQLGDEQWSAVLAQHHAALRRHLEALHGHEVKTTGDGFLATFDNPADAVECARRIRERLQELNLEVRVGIHTGQCDLSDGDVSGIAVHVASRVLSAAAPGEILVSGTVRDLLLGSTVKFEDRGRHELKGIEGEWQLFALAD
jgi:class 3 adenylate cyclase